MFGRAGASLAVAGLSWLRSVGLPIGRVGLVLLCVPGRGLVGGEGGFAGVGPGLGGLGRGASRGQRQSVAGGQGLVDGADGAGTVAYGGCYAFHGAGADVACGEDAGEAGLER